MRMLVLFDLPTGSKVERKAYAEFRKFLVNDGYTMEQYSVYSRIVLSRDNAETHLNRLKANLAPAGAVTVITLTENNTRTERSSLTQGKDQLRPISARN